VDEMKRNSAVVTSERGFGIVSVLVAIVLLAIGVVAISASSAYMVSLQTDASERARATAIAVTYMEEVKMREPATLASEDTVAVSGTGAATADGAFLRTLTVVPEPSVPDALRATVSVQYPSGFGRTGTVVMVTVIYSGN
jgi:Tfp pilus assembly protein PilV